MHHLQFFSFILHLGIVGIFFSFARISEIPADILSWHDSRRNSAPDTSGRISGIETGRDDFRLLMAAFRQYPATATCHKSNWFLL